MLDLKLIRDDPERVRAAMQRRGEDESLIDQVLKLDEQRRRYLQEAESLKHQRNRTSQQIAAMSDQAERQKLIEEMRGVGDRIKEMDSIIAGMESELQSLLLVIPNIPHESVPYGESEADNVVVRHWSEAPAFEFRPLPHWELGESLGIIDFERGSKISGARFYVLKGLGARLERALISFMIDLHVSEHGYTEIYPPFLIRRECMTGTGQLPKFEEDMYRCDPDDLFLDPTAEVPVTNLHREEILEPGALPIYYAAYTACFRREAGAAGRETRGLIRVHQFDKVELVKFVDPSQSYEELEGLVRNAERVLQKLEMPYRVTLMCTADVGFAAAKKYDLEVWMPGQDKYVEISSCSNFEDFQARRANIRYRPSATARVEYVHTINGSGLAVGRTLAALLETYQQPDGSVVVPEVLRPYMGGIEIIK